MPDSKINLRESDNKKSEKDKKKSSKSWLHLQTQSLRIRRNKSDFKMRKCSDTLKISLKKKSKKKNEEPESSSNKNNK